MSDSEIKIRHMEPEDIDMVLECEKRHLRLDEDFGVQCMEEYAWDREQLTAAVRQYRNPTKGTYDTRAFVAEIPIDTVDGPGSACWICGAMIYELHPTGYELLFFTAHDEGPPATREMLLAYLLTKAQKSPTRKRVTINIPDGDWVNLKFFQDARFNWRRVSETEGPDRWLCEFSVDKKNNSKKLVDN